MNIAQRLRDEAKLIREHADKFDPNDGSDRMFVEGHVLGLRAAATMLETSAMLQEHYDKGKA